MSANHPRLRRLAAAAARDPLRSPLFHWLHKNHGRLAPSLSGKRVDWEPLIAAAIKAGITNRDGAAPKEQVMRRTWRNVCAQVAADQAATTAAVKPSPPAYPRHPRDLPPTARPPEARPAVPVAVADQAAARQVAPAASGGFRLTLDSDGTLGGRPVTQGPLLPEPDYTGMSRSERIIARGEWMIKRRIIG